MDPRLSFDQRLLEFGERVRLGGQGIRIMAVKLKTEMHRC
jgi:hypothetical protein